MKVLQPFQVSHDGTIYRPGETAEVPDHIGTHWLRSEWVEPADTAAKRAKADIAAAIEARANRGQPTPSPDEVGDQAPTLAAGE
ncbi:hypothetical protein U8D42_12760 [Mycobacterium europaeum]|uniref:hypothetical protein n=1 Tax=Mycobacterium europaeum TaxID=761804 RepID=UPI002ADF5DC1|nr:hypothetical protein [Mycobacterium europaeum]MEA1160663.1 hypothetical protein [Mycobacterium europaeum]